MKGLIGIPHTGNLPMEFVKSLITLRLPENTEIRDLSQALIHVARERMVIEMINGGYDWLLFLDSDMTFEPDLLFQLLAHQAPVVSAMAFKRVEPYTPCFYKSLEKTEKGIKITPFDFDRDTIPTEPFLAEAVGGACLLVRREVFDKVPYPWFMPLPFTGEDISFCLRLKECGVPILIDPVPQVGHLERRPVGLHEYLEIREQMEGAL